MHTKIFYGICVNFYAIICADSASSIDQCTASLPLAHQREVEVGLRAK